MLFAYKKIKKEYIADEPTGNLDYNTSAEILRIIKEMQEKFNQSIIIVTHDPMVGIYADRIIFMHDGEIVDEYINDSKKGDIDQVLKRFKRILEVQND